MNQTKTSDAQKRASMKWIAENTDRMTIQAPKGTKERWKAAANAAGANSLTSYVIETVEERIRADADARAAASE